MWKSLRVLIWILVAWILFYTIIIINENFELLRQKEIVQESLPTTTMKGKMHGGVAAAGVQGQQGQEGQRGQQQQRGQQHDYHFWTLLVPPVTSNILGSIYHTGELECWIRQLRSFDIPAHHIHILSAGNNTAGEAIAKRHGVDIVRRPLIETPNLVPRYRYQFTKLWLFEQPGYWAYYDTDMVFHRSPVECTRLCRDKLRRAALRESKSGTTTIAAKNGPSGGGDMTRSNTYRLEPYKQTVCATPDVPMAIVARTLWRWGVNRYFNAGFFAASGSPALFKRLMEKVNAQKDTLRLFAEQAFLNEEFYEHESAPVACNYKKMWYQVSKQTPTGTVSEHAKVGIDPDIKVPEVCKDLFLSESK